MRERVQVQGPQGPQARQVTARPGAAVAAPSRIGVSKGAQLAQALAQIEPEIGAHLMEAQKEFEVKEAERAYDTLQGMTFKEAKAAVDGGKLRETENPWYEAAFQKQFGVSYAGKRKRDMMLAYETSFDKHNGNIDEFIAGYIKEDASAYGDNKFVASGIRDGMGDFTERLRDQHAEFRAQDVRSATADQFYGAAQTVVDEAVATGADPSAAVRGLYDQHRTAFGMTYQEMDDHVIGLAGKYAEEGDVATVEALLGTEVTGSDGQKVGSFLNRPKYADKAATLLNRAKAKKGDLDREAGTAGIVDLRTRAQKGQLTDDDKARLQQMNEDDVVTQSFHESLLAQNENATTGALVASQNAVAESAYKQHITDQVMAGRGFGVGDYEWVDSTGKTHTIKRDDVIGEVVDETLMGMAKAGYSESEMAATLASWGVGETFDVWENALTDGYLAASGALSRTGPDGEVVMPDAATAGYNTWKALGEHPNVRARHVKDSRALAVYRDAEALERGGMDPETALISSASIGRDPSRASLSSQLDRNQLSGAVRKSVENGWGQDAENGGFVSSTVETTARILVDKGLPADRAVEQAQRLFDESHTIINGVAVNTRNKLIPPGFDQVTEVMIDEFADLHGENPNDLTLIPSHNGEQNWVVARKDTMMPHEEWNNGGSFGILDIQRRGAAAMEDNREAARVRATEEIEVAKINKTDVVIDENFTWPTERAQVYAMMERLPTRHQSLLNTTDSTGSAYKRLQQSFGKGLYPDGGVPGISPNTR